MPPRMKFSKEEIVAAALELTRKQGFGAVTARDVGTALGVSSRPVYTAFSNMTELKGAVFAAAAQCFEAYCREYTAKATGPKYKALGEAYIGFAREEGELFKLLFMSDHTDIPCAETVDLGFSQGVSLVGLATGADIEEAMRLHTEIWIFVHGIATMIVTSTQSWSAEQISRMTSDVYAALVAKQEKGEIG